MNEDRSPAAEFRPGDVVTLPPASLSGNPCSSETCPWTSAEASSVLQTVRALVHLESLAVVHNCSYNLAGARRWQDPQDTWAAVLFSRTG